ncbi:MAG: S8 family serine peptidase, partial [Ferruginibacter sp.]|nr:S8 family serine peptidase [Cytophagales bacterium]
MGKNNAIGSHRPRTFSTGQGRGLLLFLLVTLGSASLVAAQPAPSGGNKYLVRLKDKANTPYSLHNPSRFLTPRSVQRRLKQGILLTERDLPVNPAYTDAIRQAGATLRYTSRWLNAALVEATPATLETVLRLPFVEGVEGKQALAAVRLAPGGRVSGGQSVAGPTRNEVSAPQSKPVPLQYGPSIDQVAMIGADKMHEQGYHGEGMLVAVLDAGFRNVDQSSHFRHLFTNNQVVSTYDFVRGEPGVYEDDDHGAHVLGAMAGFEEGKLVGTAYQARYILLRTEDASSESRVEEVNWLMAAEYADSAGVDVINSSLGYNTFDDPSQNYTYADLDGDKALITRAADWAAAAGILVVNSAGNEGANRWQYIAAPADGDSVLAVASVDRNQVRAPSSSKGPSADRRVKPELAALGSGAVVGVSSTGNIVTSGGTSFSAPVLAGMATGFWQAHPQLTNMQV